MSLRKRIEKSPTTAKIAAAIVGPYLKFCHRTIKWQSEGLDDLRSALAQGPVLVVTWHSRTIMPQYHWPLKDGQLSCLFNASPVGRIAGALQSREGLAPVQMSHKTSNRTASRMVLKRVKDGISIGMTGDGPFGPAREIKDAPLDWARVTGMPVFGYAYSVSRGKRVDSWDKMLFPKPFCKGGFVFARSDLEFPRKAEPEQLETLRTQFRDFMNTATARADELAGVPPGS